MSVVLVATIRPVPEERAAVIAILRTAIEELHAEEPACQVCALHDGDDRLVTVEKWRDRAALDAHTDSPALARLTSALEGRLRSPVEVVVLSPHPVGDPSKGQI